MTKWNPLALKLLMWVMGVLLVLGSGLGFIGGSFFPFDSWAGVTGSVAGVAFGAGVMVAGFDPEKNVSWVRALILYAVLEVVWQIFDEITIGHLDIIAFIIAILVAVVLVILYPNKPELLMQGARGAGTKARA